jgi:hypothetical protein
MQEQQAKFLFFGKFAISLKECRGFVWFRPLRDHAQVLHIFKSFLAVA